MIKTDDSPAVTPRSLRPVVATLAAAGPFPAGCYAHPRRDRVPRRTGGRAHARGHCPVRELGLSERAFRLLRWIGNRPEPPGAGASGARRERRRRPADILRVCAVVKVLCGHMAHQYIGGQFRRVVADAEGGVGPSAAATPSASIFGTVPSCCAVFPQRRQLRGRAAAAGRLPGRPDPVEGPGRRTDSRPSRRPRPARRPRPQRPRRAPGDRPGGTRGRRAAPRGIRPAGNAGRPARPAQARLGKPVCGLVRALGLTTADADAFMPSAPSSPCRRPA